MRTDPRADEVRSIVERVIADYRHHGRRRSTVGLGSNSQFSRQFPRLFQPETENMPADDGAAGPGEIDETILIDQGRYVARSYRTEGYLAMWLVAIGILQFYDHRGRMLATVNLYESLRPQRAAA